MGKLFIADAIRERDRFLGGIGVITIDGACNCGGRIKNIEEAPGGGVTVMFEVFVQEHAGKMEKANNYPFKFDGTCEIYQHDGNLIIRDRSTKTDAVLFPSSKNVLQELNLLLVAQKADSEKS